jgi:hypothetical protein
MTRAVTPEGLEHVRRNFRLIRSKDAGPFMLTLDLFFAGEAVHRAFRESGLLDATPVAALYGIDPAEVDTYDLPEVSALKISFPRLIPSGDFGDTDITGGQQYGLLVDYLAQQTYDEAGLPVPREKGESS